MGAAVVALPGGEIVPALERGVIDGAEFNNPSSDRVLGFPDVAKIYMIQSFHQRTETFEMLFNKGKYDALPAELKAIAAPRRRRRPRPTCRGSSRTATRKRPGGDGAEPGRARARRRRGRCSTRSCAPGTR